MQIEILAEGVIADMASFMWRHRCWGVATQAAGLKADFMSIFVEVTDHWSLENLVLHHRSDQQLSRTTCVLVSEWQICHPGC